ncbi:hypothetical protein [Microbacterium testaceum]|uniref:hypothetical protein n=1 Tax=Microbacterium testaceum TaxID=2033 RepID=UPI002AC53867|nr:hypothetical protein [Microbacterium testaceum]MDZ5146295.1 hypothetical protein [Microbacterium testaceum]
MSALQLPALWDRAGLEAVGFVGFVTFAEIPTADIPPRPGIYVVLRTAAAAPDIRESTVARAGSPYALDDLRGRWIGETPILYIGKADAKAGGLRTRLRQYARRGSSHQGGRSIWQLAEHAELLVAWVQTPGENPEEVEIGYRAAFACRFGGCPFANRRR